MADYIERPEFEQYAQRMDAEDHRLNNRMLEVEGSVKQIAELTASVKQLAESMERMLKEQEKLGERLKNIEDAPAENWKTVRVAVLTAIGTAIGVAIVAAIVAFI